MAVSDCSHPEDLFRMRTNYRCFFILCRRCNWPGFWLIVRHLHQGTSHLLLSDVLKDLSFSKRRLECCFTLFHLLTCLDHILAARALPHYWKWCCTDIFHTVANISSSPTLRVKAPFSAANTKEARKIKTNGKQSGFFHKFTSLKLSIGLG